MIPPATTSEATVIGALMRWPGLADDHDISPEMFTGANSVLAEWVLKSPAAGVEIVIQRLEDANKVEDAGGYESANDCYLAAPDSRERVDAHVETLRDRWARRQAADAANGILDAAKDIEKGDIVAAMGQPITDATNKALGMEPAMDTKAMITESLRQFAERASGRVKPMGIKTSISEWDERFLGLHRSHLVVISGFPAGGKTVLAGQVAWAAAAKGNRTLFCTLEITGPQLVDRIVTLAAGIEGPAMRDPFRYKQDNQLGEEFERNVSTGYAKLASSPFQIEDMIGANSDQVIATIRRSHRKEPISVAVVDFIQRVKPSNGMEKQSREQQLSADINRLADLAKELGITLIIPSQLNKDGAAKHAEAINEAADLHLRIEPEQKGARIVKDRHNGHTGGLLKIGLDVDLVKFTAEAHNDDN